MDHISGGIITNFPIGDDPGIIAKMQIRTIWGLMSGDAVFEALQRAISDLSKSAPADCDVLICAFDLTVTNVRYVEPHTFIFEGFDGESHPAFAACHFSQLVAHIIYVPKRGPERIITGFSVDKPSS